MDKTNHKTKLALGTVQLGMPYGAANRTGQPGIAEATTIIEHAVASGVTEIDCAQAYGDAEVVVGRALDTLGKRAEHLTLITKLAPTADETTVDTLIDESLQRLTRRPIDVLMLHRWDHYHAAGGRLWQSLCKRRAAGDITHLGVSVQSPEEALAALEDKDIQYIQLPFNLLDWRWKEAGVPQKLVDRKDIVVHARSTLLQGILPAAESTWPRHDDIHPAQWISKLQALTQQLGRTSVADLCFAYVRAQPWIASIVVGVETMDQLTENIGLFNRPTLSPAETERVEQELMGASETLLNPARW